MEGEWIMKKETGNTDPAHCPTCGSLMQRVQGEPRLICPVCNPISNATETAAPTKTAPTQAYAANTPAARFRKLTTQSKATVDHWPEDLLEDVPEEARDLLRGSKRTPAAPHAEELREDFASTLRDQCYVINLDAHGVRISGGPSSRSPDSGTMSPYDVVRLAADLEGGVPTPDQRKHCPKCDAVIPQGESRCPWCGETLPTDIESPPEA